jgi:uroporphyrinogen decarboxylase
MTPREKFLMALDGKQPPGRVPHFELVFYLTMEVFGKVHPEHRIFGQWGQMSETERQLQRRDMAQLYVDIAERFEHSCIYMTGPRGWGQDQTAEVIRVCEQIREISGDEYAVFVPGDGTYMLPGGNSMVAFAVAMVEEPQRLKDEAQQSIDACIANVEQYAASGVIDGIGMCADYCFNDNPFCSPTQFDDFITPYLKQQIAAYRGLGMYTFKHTDGNIMPILDSLVECNPHSLHSLDPQGGIDMAEIKRLIGDRICLIGNVNCGMLQTGTEAECIESARYALKHGMPGGGYVFSTSNCVYTGMDLKRYELIQDVWRKEGNYPE